MMDGKAMKKTAMRLECEWLPASYGGAFDPLSVAGSLYYRYTEIRKAGDSDSISI